jgi:hypothetical protein
MSGKLNEGAIKTAILQQRFQNLDPDNEKLAIHDSSKQSHWYLRGQQGWSAYFKSFCEGIGSSTSRNHDF